MTEFVGDSTENESQDNGLVEVTLRDTKGVVRTLEFALTSTMAMDGEPAEEWPLAGEHSYQWLCKYIAEHGGTHRRQHVKWLEEASLQ